MRHQRSDPLSARPWQVPRWPILLLGMMSLLGGVLAGLARLGWAVPPVAASAAGGHGALMISAFFGTVISLERAVALGRPWAFLAPAAAGAGGIAALVGSPAAAAVLAVIAATVMMLSSVQVLRRLVAPFTVVLAIGAGCWLTGNLVWLLDGALTTAIPWWLAFLVLTIAGERLELSRLLATPPRAQKCFHAIVALIVGGAALHLAGFGFTVFSAGLLCLSVWLLRYDIAWHNVRRGGLPRFIAICLLIGYGWLIVAGLLGLTGAFEPGDRLRDSALHAVGLGFVFSMVFGHAPIIFPAVARVRIPYHPVFYVPLLALHGSLLVRIAGGLSGHFSWLRDGAVANAVALLLFILTVLASVVRGLLSAPRTGTAPKRSGVKSGAGNDAGNQLNKEVDYGTPR